MGGDEACREPEGARTRFYRRSIFDAITFTYEDDRFCYAERRFVTLGLLAGVPVSIAHTESEHEIRIISFRKATHREAQIYFDEIQD